MKKLLLLLISVSYLFPMEQDQHYMLHNKEHKFFGLAQKSTNKFVACLKYSDDTFFTHHSNAFEITDMLISNKNAAKGFGKTILSAFVNVARQEGRTYVTAIPYMADMHLYQGAHFKHIANFEPFAVLELEINRDEMVENF